MIEDTGDLIMLETQQIKSRLVKHGNTQARTNYARIAKASNTRVNLTGIENFQSWWYKTKSNIDQLGMSDILDEITNNYFHLKVTKFIKDEEDVIKDLLISTVKIPGYSINTDQNLHECIINILSKVEMVTSFSNLLKQENSLKIDIKATLSENLSKWELFKLKVKISKFPYDEWKLAKTIQANLEAHNILIFLKMEMANMLDKHQNVRVTDVIKHIHRRMRRHQPHLQKM